MSKMLEASCVGGIVTADGVAVPAADILSEGVGESEGVLLLDENLAKYIPKASPDLKTTLLALVSALESIASALSAVNATANLITTCGAGPGTATWVPPIPTGTIDDVTDIKDQLEDLSEAMI